MAGIDRTMAPVAPEASTPPSTGPRRPLGGVRAAIRRRFPALRGTALAVAVTAASALAAATGWPAPAAPAAADPVDCATSTVYAAQPGADGRTTLGAADFDDEGLTFAPVGEPAPLAYDALAVDPATAELYAAPVLAADATGVDSHGALVRTGDLLRIDPADGHVTTLGPPPGLPATGFDAAAFTDDGSLFLFAADSADYAEYVPATGQVMTHRLASADGVPTDVAWSAGYLWGRTDDGSLLRLNPRSGATRSFAMPADVPATGDTTGVFTYGNGNLGIVAGGTAVQLEIRTPDYPTFVVVATGEARAAAGTDLAACVSAGTDLAVEQRAPESVAASGDVELEIEVRNAGTTRSSGWVVTEVLPAGYTDVRVPAGCTVSGTTVACAGAALAAGASADVTITATAPPTAQCSYATATVLGNEAETNDADNAAQATTCVDAAPVLEVGVSADPTDGDVVRDGETVAYTVTAANTGNTSLTDVVLTADLADVLDDATAVDGSLATTVGAAPVLEAGSLEWTGSLGVGRSVELRVEVRVDDGFAGDDRLAMSASGASAEADGVCAAGAGGEADCAMTHVPTPTPTSTATTTPTTPVPATSAPATTAPSGTSPSTTAPAAGAGVPSSASPAPVPGAEATTGADGATTSPAASTPAAPVAGAAAAAGQEAASTARSSVRGAADPV